MPYWSFIPITFMNRYADQANASIYMRVRLIFEINCWLIISSQFSSDNVSMLNDHLYSDGALLSARRFDLPTSPCRAPPELTQDALDANPPASVQNLSQCAGRLATSSGCKSHTMEE